MQRHRKSIAIACIAVVLLAAFIPGVAIGLSAVLEPGWVLLPPASDVVIYPFAPVCSDEQPASLLSLLASRAPPASLDLA
jgi:hypothetical protein